MTRTALGHHVVLVDLGRSRLNSDDSDLVACDSFLAISPALGVKQFFRHSVAFVAQLGF
jgi:hypothetical protein